MKALVTALLAVFVLAAVSCGGDPAQEQADAYVEGLNDARAALSAELERLATKAPPTSTPKSEARLLLSYERAFTKASGRVRALKPPQPVRAQHAGLLAALRKYEVALGKARAIGAKAPAGSIPVVRDRLADELEQANTALDDQIAQIARLLRRQ